MITEITNENKNVSASDMVQLLECIALLVFVETALALINNTQIEARNVLENKETRRNNEKHRSTSSSSGAIESKVSGDDTLGISDSLSSESKGEKKHHDRPKSSEERKGWRKWHRKCTPCPEDMKKKWRDQSINWICGAYQRARRSFKSLCMMYYRNCQDGTMFIKIHDHRCANSSKINPHGDHFFYEYNVVLSDDGTNSKTESDTTSDESSSV